MLCFCKSNFKYSQFASSIKGIPIKYAQSKQVMCLQANDSFVSLFNYLCDSYTSQIVCKYFGNNNVFGASRFIEMRGKYPITIHLH